MEETYLKAESMHFKKEMRKKNERGEGERE